MSSVELLSAVPFISRLPHSSLYISRNLSISFSLNSFRWPSFTFFLFKYNLYEHMSKKKKRNERNSKERLLTFGVMVGSPFFENA